MSGLDGWYLGYAPAEGLDENGKTIFVDSKNVAGRFRDHETIDVEASKKAGRAVYRPEILLETRNLRDLNGLASPDMSSQLIRFAPSFREASMAAIERFPEAWAAYQRVRTAPRTEAETDALGEPEPPKKERKKPGPKPKPKGNVVPLTGTK